MAEEHSIGGNIAQWRQAGLSCFTPAAANHPTPLRLSEIPNLLDKADERVLLGLAQKVGFGKAIEVGRFAGWSTALLALSGFDVWSIDLELPRSAFGPAYASLLSGYDEGCVTVGDCARVTMREARVADRVTLVRGSSLAAESWPPARDYDLAFIDGGHDHTTCLSDLGNAWWRLVPSGTLAIHDYDLRCRYPNTGVDTAVEQFLQSIGPGAYAGPYAADGSSIVWIVKVA